MNKIQRIEEMEKQLSALKAEVEQESKVKVWEPVGRFIITGNGELAKGEDENYDKFGMSRISNAQAIKAIEPMRIRNRLAAYVDEFAPDYKPDWENFSMHDHFVFYDLKNKNYNVAYSAFNKNLGLTYMPEKVARELVKKLESGEVVL